MSFNNVDWTLAGGIIITGLVVVFFVLAFLWFSITVIGKVCTIINTAMKKNAPVAPVAAPAPAVPVATQKLSGEMVAVITAAAASVTDKNFKIKSISLKGSTTPLWKSEN